jgi:hypothetical protein
MASITRKKTNEKVHLYASSIKAYQVNKDSGEAVFNCVLTSASGADGEEKVYTASPNMLRRLATGNGAIHKDMQYGIKALPHFTCVLLASKEKPSYVEGVHMIPTDNYNAADMSLELEMPVASDAAIVQMYETGEIDVLAYPSPMYSTLIDFVKALEQKETLSPGDQFTVGKSTYTVQRVLGDVVHIRCRRPANIR